MSNTKLKMRVETLKTEFGDDHHQRWWYNGIPQSVRQKAVGRLEEDQGKSEREEYLDLIDFRTIVVKNWSLFVDSLAYGAKGNKDKRTQWIVQLNDIRKIVMHPAKRQVISWDQLAELERYEQWIQGRAEGRQTEIEPD